MKLEEFGYALNDASEVCSPSFIPAFVESASYRSSNPVGSQVRESALSVRLFLLIKVLERNRPGFCRRAMCYLQILKPQAAVLDFKKVISLEPSNEIVKSQLVSTQKLIRRIEFEKVG